MNLKLAIALSLGSLCPALHAQDTNLAVLAETIVDRNILDIATGDFNQDGNIDVIAEVLDPNPPFDTELRQFLGNGDGSLTEVSRFGTSQRGGIPPTIADFTGDGIPDLINANQAYATNSDGTLGAGQDISNRLQNCRDGHVIDVDKDGMLDFVCPYNNTFDTSVNPEYGLSVLKNYGNFDFRLTTIESLDTQERQYPIVTPRALLRGDINNDGVDDFTTISNAFESPTNRTRERVSDVSTFTGNGTGYNFRSSWTTTDFFDNETPWSSNSLRQSVLTDTNNDNNLDLVVIVAGEAARPIPFISVHTGDGNGNFAEQGITTMLTYVAVSTNPENQNTTQTFDANGDGLEDLIIGHIGRNQATEPGILAVMHSNGDGTFAAPISLTTNRRNITTVTSADFNNDGRTDIVAGVGFDFSRIIVLSATAGVSSGNGNNTSDGNQNNNMANDGFCSSLDSDPDGDGWGWENNQSCRVASGTSTNPVSSTPTAGSSLPACTQADSDSDNDGYGWENNASCFVTNSSVTDSGNTNTTSPTISTIATCQLTTSDSDGDGWGWENNASCRVQ